MAGTSFLRTGANSPEVARRDRVQDRAKLRGALATEHRLEPRLRLCPVLGGRTQPRGAGIGHVQLLAAAVGAPFRYGDEFLALERQDVPPQRRPIPYEVAGERVDRRRPHRLQLRLD